MKRVDSGVEQRGKVSRSDQLKRMCCNYPNGSYNGIFKTQPDVSAPAHCLDLFVLGYRRRQFVFLIREAAKKKKKK